MTRYWAQTRLACVSLALCLPFLNASAYFGGPGRQVPVVKSANTSPYGYYEYLPQNYSETSGQKFPVILFLHGIGEEGNGGSDLYQVINHGPSFLISQGRQFPGLVFSPQSSGWWSTSTINSFVNYIYANYKGADPSRLYLTGLSMGGGGAWDYATAYPEKIAALVPIAGASSPTAARSKLYGIPTWVFHSFNDPTVAPSNSIGNIDYMTPESASIMTGYPYGNATNTAASTDMIALYSKAHDTHQWYAGGTTTDQTSDKNIRFTFFQTGGHDSWTRAYDDDNLWNWMFLQAKASSPAPSPSPSVAASPVPFNAGSVMIDFGDAKTAATGVNVADTGMVTGGTLAKLRNLANAPTSAALTVVKAFNAANSNGTTAPATSTGFSATTTSDSWFGNDVLFGGTTAPSAQLELDGLDPTVKYDFRFFASRMSAGGDNRETQYTVTGLTAATAKLNASENTANVAVITGIQPNGNGRILIDVKKGSANTNSYGFFYLGGMKVTAGAFATSSASSSETSTPISVIQDIRVDFGAGGTPTTNWNDGSDIARSGSIALRTMAGATTPYDLVMIAPFNGANSDGTTAPAAALGLPAIATQDSFFGNDVLFNGFTAAKAVMEVRDLDPTKAYTFEFFASRMGVTDNRETQYAVIGSTTSMVKLNVANNTSQVATSAAVKPNASGVIRIEISKGSANNNPYGFFYLGSLRIRY